ncbi:MAG TPA: glycosyltransferase [Proteobacteria bacterium]|nr:glycosyltransferase [Pseudomonadota bacterium]
MKSLTGHLAVAAERPFSVLAEPALVTVIIPCYQAGATIGRALASVAAQTLRPAEVIIVDDGSDAETRAVLGGLLASYGDGWLKLFFLETNQGPAAARNYAWDRATQPLLAFLDADDSWHPEKIAIQYAFMKEHPEFALSGHFCDGVRPEAALKTGAYRITEVRLAELLYRNRLRTPSVMLRRRLPDRFPENFRYGEDFSLWLQLLAASERAALIGLSLAQTHKAAFGATGQSAALWAMEKGELQALYRMRRAPGISGPRLAGACFWSLLKFCRRFLLTAGRRLSVPEERRPGPPTILFLVTDDWFFLLHRRALALAAQQAGCRVLVATAPGPRVAEIKSLGFPHFPLKLRRSSRNPLRELLACWDIAGLYRRQRPDLVHQVSIKPIIYGSLAARLTGIGAVVNAVTGLGFVFITGGAGKNYLRRLVEAAYRLAGGGRRVRFLFENPDDRRHFLDRKIVGPEKTRLILGSGVDLERFSASFSSPSDPAAAPVVLLAARMLWHKGIREYVEAARLLLQEGLNAEFWLAGMPDTSNPAAVSIARLLYWHGQGVVRWLGYQKDMPALYRQVDIVCLPTRYREGIPVTLLEAAACGKSLVATDMPGCREIVRSGENGFLVPPGSVSELAAALKTLLLDPALRRRFGLRGRQLVAQEFSDKKVIAATFSVYHELLGTRWEALEKS